MLRKLNTSFISVTCKRTPSDSECGRLSQESELDGLHEGRARKGRSQEEHNGHSARYTQMLSVYTRTWTETVCFFMNVAAVARLFKFLYWLTKQGAGRRIAQSVARATHVPRLCSGPGFDSRPGSLCCVSLPVSYPVSCLSLQLYYQIKKPERPKKYFKKKTKQGATFVYTDLEILISIFSMKTNCYHTIYIFATFLTGEMDKS